MKLELQEFFHNTHIVALAVKDGHDISCVILFFIQIENEVILAGKKTESVAFQNSVARN